MSGNKTSIRGEGELRESLHKRRVWQAALVPGLVAVGILFAVKQGLGGSIWLGPAQLDPAFAIAFGVVIALFTLIGALWHHRSIDELEERAILWGNTVGFYTVVASALIVEVLTMARLISPISHVMLMLGSLAAAVGTYLWVRFR